MPSKNLNSPSQRKPAHTKGFFKLFGTLCLLIALLSGCGYKRKNFFRRSLRLQNIVKLSLPFIEDLSLNGKTLSWKPIEHAQLKGYLVYSAYPQRRFVKEATLTPEKSSFTLSKKELTKRYIVTALFSVNNVLIEGPTSRFVSFEK